MEVPAGEFEGVKRSVLSKMKKKKKKEKRSKEKWGASQRDWGISENEWCGRGLGGVVGRHVGTQKSDLDSPPPFLCVCMTDWDVTVCPIPKSDHRIKRYHKIKFSQSACIVWSEADHVWLIEINFDWLMIKIN